MTRIKYDDKGAPYLARDKSDEPPKSHRTHVLLGIERFPLWHDDGRPTSPTEALDMLLSDGPITASQFDHLASQFDNPEVIYSAAEQLGAIRKKREDGALEVLLPEPEQESNEVHLAETGREESTRMGIKESPDYQAAGLVPLREAQEMLGQPVIGSGLTIIREGRNRFVNKAELRAHLSRVGRGGKAPGAGAKIAGALEDATQRRAATNRAGQANDAHRRRYGQAKLGGRD